MVCFDAPKVLEKFIPMLVQLILEQHQSQNILIEHFKVFSGAAPQKSSFLHFSVIIKRKLWLH